MLTLGRTHENVAAFTLKMRAPFQRQLIEKLSARLYTNLQIIFYGLKLQFGIQLPPSYSVVIRSIFG